MPIQAGMVSKAIEGAQRQVESMHFSARKNVLEYDDVMNLQRAAIYGERNAILDGKDLSERIPEICLLYTSCQMVGPMALAGRLLQESGHRETLLSRRQRIGPVGFDHHSGEVSI